MPVTFNEEAHRYTSHNGRVYTSVTSLIKKYTPPFDADYWSAYKALKAVLSETGEWDSYKKKAGGWENVVAFARSVDKDFPYRKQVIQKKKEILAEWEANKENALSKGTEYHKMKERHVKEKIVYSPDMQEIQVLSGVDLLAAQQFSDNGLYPELIIYNDDWEIAGQADWVMKVGQTVHIKDYKTSKEISKTAFQSQCLMHPLSSIPNANFYTYSLQISLYALMLEQKGYKVGNLAIEHVDKETFETIGMYSVTYMRKEAIKLVKHYVKEKYA
jgi:hypothetical protein